MAYLKSKHGGGVRLSQWSKSGYWSRQNEILGAETKTYADQLVRVSSNELTVEKFIEQFEVGEKPCVITDATANWLAKKSWQIQRLVQREGSSIFKIALAKVKMSLIEYVEYAFFNRDDSPLCLCETNL